MKILIVGSDLNALLLAEYIKIQTNENDLYITLDGDYKDKNYISIGIRENDVSAVCDFVKYNQIDLTIVTSGLAIINGIADIFEKEGFPIIAPFSEAARATFFTSIAKKVMYKLKINTPRFGIFDRENIASDYIRRAKFPIVIMNDFTITKRINEVYNNFRNAKIALQKIFENNDEKIVIENYIESIPIYIFFLTDGYSVLPLISMEKQEKNGYIQIKAPSKQLPNNIMKNILTKSVFPFIDDIAEYAGNYSGILGMKVKIKDNNIYVLEYYNNFQDYDLQVFLSLLDENIVELFKKATNKNLKGSKNAKLKNKSSYTLIMKKSKIVNEVEDDELMITEDDKNIIMTKTALTINSAKQYIEEYIEMACDKKNYEEIKNINKEELRI